MCISSALLSGLQFDLVVKPVPGTTSEQLSKLRVGEVVELGPVMGRGFAIQHINPPPAAETLLLFAVGVGIRSVHSEFSSYLLGVNHTIIIILILCIFNAVRFVHLSSLVLLPLKEIM